MVALETVPDRPETARREALTEAYATARALLRALLPQIASAVVPADAARQSALRRLEGPALALMASILVTAHKTPGEATASPDLPANWRLELDNTLDALTTPFASDPQLTAADMLVWTGAGDVVLSDRTRFTLACYWSRTAAFASGAARAHAVKESLRQLELALALRDPDLTAWAERDPGLGWVQSARPDAIRRLTARDPSGELAGVRAIGPSLAAKLEADHGIGTAEALAKTTSAERNTVATALGVSRSLVDRWAGLAALRALPQLTTNHANQLDEAGVRSPAGLGRLTADELARKLVIAGLRHDPVPKLPDHALLDVWIVEAASRLTDAGGPARP